MRVVGLGGIGAAALLRAGGVSVVPADAPLATVASAILGAVAAA